jgi:SRSO17 transposase
VASDEDQEIGDDKKACLLLDETGIQKQCKESVCVSRQWLGRIGKVDNGQVALFGALANGT